ncbi:MAG: AMP-binding protein [Gammaproteobacteria bacterium]|nr:AMP-binding protein [Gammaproteobacteria bacterium]
MAGYTSHLDTFARDNLPPARLQPEFLFRLPALRFPERLNCATELLDRKIRQGFANRPALHSPHETWSYERLLNTSNRIARVLTEDLGVVAGARVLIRAPNSPMLAACWLAIMKAGAIAVATMPLLRSRDLEPIIRKARVEVALCEERLLEELLQAQKLAPVLARVCSFRGSGTSDAELEGLLSRKEESFQNVETASDDVALIAFTSGTTGDPKGTMHFHRDLMSVCVAVCDHLVHPAVDDIFIGTPPLAFTYGLGMQLLFPLYAGASTVLLEAPTPQAVAESIGRFGATICASAPTGYRAILRDMDQFNLGTLRACVSAGEHLPLSTFEEWKEATGIAMIDGLGATEMLHIFVAAAGETIRPGATGCAVAGYEICILDEDHRPLPAGERGRLAVKGPTGCKYLSDPRQAEYVVGGWNVTGDLCAMDEQGYVWYHGRADDMIVSAGYNISAGEVESVLMAHPAVAECAVVGAPDPERGTIVKAFVVLSNGCTGTRELVRELQEFAKQTVAPYKYPRAVEFVAALPRTHTGKLQRHKLRSPVVDQESPSQDR